MFICAKVGISISKTSRISARQVSSSIGRGSGISLVELSLSHAELEGARSQNDLTKALKNIGVLKSSAVVEAFGEVDRALFVDDRSNDAAKGRFTYSEPYSNSPLKIGHTGATMSTPHHHAVIAEIIADVLRPGDKVLDLGCGSGYLAAIFSKLVCSSGMGAEQGKVVAVECVPELLKLTESNLKKAGCENGVVLLDAYSSSRNNSDKLNDAIFVDKFKAIHVSFAMEKQELEKQFLDNIVPGGRIVAPIRDETGNQPQKEQILTIYQKDIKTHKISSREVMRVLCQPMIKEMISDQPKQTVNERIAELQDILKTWTEGFKASNNGKHPTREDIFNDETAKNLFTEFSKLRQRKW